MYATDDWYSDPTAPKERETVSDRELQSGLAYLGLRLFWEQHKTRIVATAWILSLVAMLFVGYWMGWVARENDLPPAIRALRDTFESMP